MDRNIEIIITEMRDIGTYAHEKADQLEKYYQGFGYMKKIEWINAEECKPEDNLNCLVSWWDYEKGYYVQPIRAYWLEDHQRFYVLDSINSIAVEVDIWCYWPELPKERL